MLDKAAKAAGRVLLPDYVVPTKYNLKITPDLVQYTFDGLVSIDMTTKETFPTEEASKQITLHSKELMYRTAKFQTTDGNVVTADEVRPSINNIDKHYCVVFIVYLLVIVAFCRFPNYDNTDSCEYERYYCNVHLS